MPVPDQPLWFDFEVAASENLTYIPMCVRFNLDQCDIHLSLAQWQALPQAQRAELARQPLALAAEGVSAARAVERAIEFAAALNARLAAAGLAPLEADMPAIAARVGAAEQAPWRQCDAVPSAVLKQCALHALPALHLSEWRSIAPFQRYVLLKLSRRDAANHDFLPALQDFGLFSTD
jgi:hypothetical protein